KSFINNDVNMFSDRKITTRHASLLVEAPETPGFHAPRTPEGLPVNSRGSHDPRFSSLMRINPGGVAQCAPRVPSAWGNPSGVDFHLIGNRGFRASTPGYSRETPTGFATDLVLALAPSPSPPPR